jgi:hypothetical protein
VEGEEREEGEREGERSTEQYIWEYRKSRLRRKEKKS